MHCDRLWKNARLATMTGQGLGLVDKGLVACGGGDIVYAGPEAEAPAFTAPEVVDCAGRWITPGLVDCHTHIVHGGNRAHEFELRLAGATYEELARAGGGIVSTMKATRAASEDELLAQALPRVDALIAEGVTTLEVKSGYGLERAAEMKSLKAARRLGEVRPLSVTTTFLGAHALPPEAAGDKDAYIDLVCRDKPADTLVFVEVKTRATEERGRPADAVDYDKQRQVAKGAMAWLRLLNFPDLRFRFDIVEVLATTEVTPEITLIRNAFPLPEYYVY